MSYFQFIPEHLLLAHDRIAFLAWLRTLPVAFHSRLRVYFAWLDFHSASYTADEIESLNQPETTFDSQPPI